MSYFITPTQFGKVHRCTLQGIVSHFVLGNIRTNVWTLGQGNLIRIRFV